MMVFIIACKRSKPLEFTQLKQFCRIDTMKDKDKTNMSKTDCYIVSNYEENPQTEQTIDSFAYKNRALDLKKYASYQIIMYKSSDVTNIEHLKQNPRDFDDYTFDNDKIFVYVWGNGAFSGKFKYHKLENVEAQPMIREN